jgi:hypothetical protein
VVLSYYTTKNNKMMFPIRSRKSVLLVLLSTAAMSLVSLLVTLPVATAFAPQVSFTGHRHQKHAPISKSTAERAFHCYTSTNVHTSTLLLASMDHTHTGAEVEEMEQLILSLSREATDELRRDRVRAILIEGLSKPNEDPERFTDLFNQTLIIVGDRVKLLAQQKAIKLQAEAEAAAEKDDVDNDESSLAPPPDEAPPAVAREKSPDELQLWALVDMMIQSRTIIKKESGELGNKGTFT